MNSMFAAFISKFTTSCNLQERHDVVKSPDLRKVGRGIRDNLKGKV